MNGNRSSERQVGRRELIRRIGVGSAIAATGIAGVTTQVAASHTDEPTIDIPDEQTAKDHPRFNEVIKINEGYLPDGGYITVTGDGVSGQSIVELPAGHFRNSSVVVQAAPDDATVEVTARISRSEGGEDPYTDENGDEITDTGTVNF